MEAIPDLLEPRSEPYEFVKDLISVSVFRRRPHSNDSFEEASKKLNNAIVVRNFESRVRLNSTFKRVKDDAPSETLDETAGVISDFRMSVSELRKDFETASKSPGQTGQEGCIVGLSSRVLCHNFFLLPNLVPENTSRTFSVMLTVTERFRFAHFDHSGIFFPDSKSRKVSPVMFIGKLDQPNNDEHVIVSFTAKVDDLIKVLYRTLYTHNFTGRQANRRHIHIQAGGRETNRQTTSQIDRQLDKGTAKRTDR